MAVTPRTPAPTRRICSMTDSPEPTDTDRLEEIIVKERGMREMRYRRKPSLPDRWQWWVEEDSCWEIIPEGGWSGVLTALAECRQEQERQRESLRTATSDNLDKLEMLGELVTMRGVLQRLKMKCRAEIIKRKGKAEFMA